MAKARIGYIGVGLMGLPMAARLVTRGYQVTALILLSRQEITYSVI